MSSMEIIPRPTDIIASRGVVEHIKLDDAPDKPLRFGLIVAFLFFVVLGGWAAIARLDAAAAGEGQIAVAGNRQTVQHREGGIVEKLDVKDGQHVAAGQVLLNLRGAEVAATERALAGSVIDLQAQHARLEAEVRGVPVQWPASFKDLTGDNRELAEHAMALQIAQRNARAGSLAASRAVLGQQQSESAQQSGGYIAQSRASAEQRASLQQQLESTRKLADEGYVSRNSVRSLERAIQQLEGQDAEYASRAAASQAQIGQMSGQMVQGARRYAEDASTLLNQTQFQLNDLLPKWIAAKDQLDRTIVRAPVAGRVVGLRVFSEGGVVQAGQPILDIVPDAAPLIIKANFSPGDIDGVYAGRQAEVKFLSMHERDLPILLGTVRNVSADSLRDETSGRSYFSAEIAVPRSQIEMLAKVRGADSGIRPGVPVSVLVKLRKRTALQYLLDPLIETFSRSMRER